MKLSILIVTQGRRQQKLRRLLAVLLPQCTAEVEVLLYQNNCEESIGHYRKALIEASNGEYVCFVDDDDMVPSYYIEELLSHIKRLPEPDYIGFEVELTHDGRPERRAFHSLRYATWDQDAGGYYRNITHLNPLKRSIAVQGVWPMTKGQMGEDVSWANTVQPLTHTEHYIGKTMYYYRHDSADTSFGGEDHQAEIYYVPMIIRL